MDLKLKVNARGKLDIILDPTSADPALIGGRDNVLQAVDEASDLSSAPESPTWGFVALLVKARER